MNNHDFIASFGTQKYKVYSSLVRDDDGNIYSFGFHYPLLFSIGSLWYRNTAGYSSTTSRHIGIAGQWSDVDVEIPNNGRRGVPKYWEISEWLATTVTNLEEQLGLKKRKDTKIYAQITEDLERARQNLARHLDNNQDGYSEKGAPNEGKHIADNFKAVSMVARMGEIFHAGDEKGINDWKKRMLSAGLENLGLSFPDDWDTLTEQEKKIRLDGAINQINE